MRRNIDLTENMIFSSPSMEARGINLRLLEKNFGRKFHLWSPYDWSNGEAKDSIIEDCHNISYYVIKRTLLNAIKRTILDGHTDNIIQTQIWKKLISNEIKEG